MAVGTKREFLERRRTALRNTRATHEPAWKSITQVLAPYRTVWEASERNRGDRRDRLVFNNKPLLSVRSLAAWILAGMSSPAREWFSFTLEDEDLAKYKPVRIHLEQRREIIQAVLARSTWYRALVSASYPDMITIGTTNLALEMADAQVRFNPLPIGEYCLDVDQFGRVDTCYRELAMPVRNMVKKFGREACSSSVRNAWDRGNYEIMIPVYHAVQPREDFSYGKQDSLNMPYQSCWWEAANERLDSLLGEGGYMEFPFLTPRWNMVSSSDAYGRGPGSDVEGDVLVLQHHEKRLMAIIDKITDPPVTARGNIKRASLLPGAFIPLGNQDIAEVRAIQEINPQAINVMMERIKQVQDRIGEGLYDHLWALLYGDERNQRPTATEVEATRTETALQMGPLLLAANEELLEPCVERLNNILDRHGDLPEPPPELDGQTIKVEFKSILQTLQQSHGLISTRALVQEIRMIAEVRPDVLDKLAVDAIADELQRVTGARADALLDDKEVAAIRDAKVQQQQAQQQGEAMGQAADAMQTLSQTDTTSLAELASKVGPAVAAQGGALGRVLRG